MCPFLDHERHHGERAGRETGAADLMITALSTLAHERPTDLALCDRRCALGWAEVEDTLHRAANALQATDLGPRRRVAILAENSAEAALAHVAAIVGGTSAVLLSSHLTAGEVAEALARCGVGLLFVGPETASRGRVAADRAGVGTVVAWRCRPASGLTDWEEWLTDASAAPPPLDGPARPPVLLTSGTTGRPRAVTLPPTMFAPVSSIAAFAEAQATHKFAGLGAHLVVGPLSHTGPSQGPRLLLAGTPVVVSAKFDPEAVLAAIDRYRIASSVMVPTHFVRMLALDDAVRHAYDTSSLRHVVHTGAACPPEVKRRMLDWWGPVLWESYGATEVGTVCTISSADWEAHPGSVGQALAPFEACVVDEDGEAVAPGQVGRLYFVDHSGRGVVYEDEPEAAAAAHLEPGVFTLGEIGRVDAEGWVYVTDRFSELVVSGGVNIAPSEPEQVLRGHPAVDDVVCVGLPDDDLGERLVAVVVLRPDAACDEAELLAWCRERLSLPKCPRSVIWLDDLGRTPMGKLNRRTLRDRIATPPAR